MHRFLKFSRNIVISKTMITTKSKYFVFFTCDKGSMFYNQTLYFYYIIRGNEKEVRNNIFKEK